MINTPRQKEYYQKEQKMFMHICAMIVLLIAVSIGILFIWTNYKDNMSGTQISLLFGVIIIFFLIATSIYTTWEQKYRKIIFDNAIIEAHCIELKEIGYKSFLTELKKEKSVFSDEEKDINLLSISHEAKSFKVFISRMGMITADDSYKMNLKCIEKENSLGKDLSNDRSLRINLLFIDDYNINAKELVSNNASNTLSHKRYTSIVVDLSNDKLYIPAHFGLNNMNNYKKMMSMLELIFFKYLK